MEILPEPKRLTRAEGFALLRAYMEANGAREMEARDRRKGGRTNTPAAPAVSVNVHVNNVANATTASWPFGPLARAPHTTNRKNLFWGLVALALILWLVL